MNENKNRRLAKEITDFCKERLTAPSAKPKGAKSLLHAALASFLALALVSGAEPNRGSYWMV